LEPVRLESATPEEVEAGDSGGALVYKDGSRIPFAACAAIFPQSASPVLEAAGLTDKSGFVPADVISLRATAVSDGSVFALGDCAKLVLNGSEMFQPNVGAPKLHPKAGAFAVDQARRVVAAIKAELVAPNGTCAGAAEAGAEMGKGRCYFEAGRGEVFAIAADLRLREQEQPHFTFVPPSRDLIAGKLAFINDHADMWFRSFRRASELE
jgi:hypothetical protein